MLAALSACKTTGNLERAELAQPRTGKALVLFNLTLECGPATPLSGIGRGSSVRICFGLRGTAPVTCLGNLHGQPMCAEVMLGISVLAGVLPELRNEAKRDLAPIRKASTALDAQALQRATLPN